MNFNRPTNGLTSKVLFLSLIILLIAAGCSGTSDDDKAQRPTRLVVYSTVDAVHDPLLALTSEQQFLMSLENRTLFSLSTSGDITANLAQSHSVSDDGKKITVQLAENTFTDGTDITSSDVKATLARVASAGGELADLVENVKGSGEAKSGADFLGSQHLMNAKLSSNSSTPIRFSSITSHIQQHRSFLLDSLIHKGR
jgi:ABC-type transport system substrate-binding protein